MEQTALDSARGMEAPAAAGNEGRAAPPLIASNGCRRVWLPIAPPRTGRARSSCETAALRVRRACEEALLRRVGSRHARVAHSGQDGQVVADPGQLLKIGRQLCTAARVGRGKAKPGRCPCWSRWPLGAARPRAWRPWGVVAWRRAAVLLRRLAPRKNVREQLQRVGRQRHVHQVLLAFRPTIRLNREPLPDRHVTTFQQGRSVVACSVVATGALLPRHRLSVVASRAAV